ncbi:hypothetical protein OSB04_014980 [Centaurea solstitialis]|uniref:Uncharacterized protein n=1 Tax=Centaurea solstitialis TaxID=347529 RepID=A0AA38SY39_9ASTR|nr:hypothetical protein OSB04_014980 [Centaurea solstitialis]
MESGSKPQSKSSLGLLGIFRESFKATNRNKKLLVPILLLVFLSISKLDLAQNYILAPIDERYENLELQFARNPPTGDDLRLDLNTPFWRATFDVILEFFFIKVIFLALSSIVLLVFFVATVSSSYEAYNAKVLGPKKMLLKIRTNWTKPLLTSFYMILITLGIVFLVCISSFIAILSARNSWSRVYFGGIAILILVWYFYVAALWIFSIVVSVLEEGFVGVKAIGRAAELLSGKRLQASILMILFAISYVVIDQMNQVLITRYDLSTSTRLAISICFTNGLNSLLTIFMFVLFTVFYHERKTSHDEKEVKGLYIPIAAGEA